jgi:hypothetical protein
MDNEDRRLMLEGLAERAGKLLAEQHIAAGGDGKYLGLAVDAFARMVGEHATTALRAGTAIP